MFGRRVHEAGAGGGSPLVDHDGGRRTLGHGGALAGIVLVHEGWAVHERHLLPRERVRDWG